jgi:hypothetical protein
MAGVLEERVASTCTLKVEGELYSANTQRHSPEIFGDRNVNHKSQSPPRFEQHAELENS